MSVVIVTYCSASHIEGCLRSIRVALSGLEAEVIVVDNASTDNTAAVLSRWPEVRLLERRVNDGFAAGVTAGATVARARRLVVVNPDVVVVADTIRQLLCEAEAHPRAGVIGGRAVHRDGTTDFRSWWGRPTVWSLACFASGLSALRPGSAWFDPESSDGWDGESRQVPAVSGALMLIDRECFDVMGGFDRTFLLYGEDVDLCLRAREAGWAPRVCGGAVFEHAVGASSGGSTPGRLVLVLRGRATLIRRHLPCGARLLGIWLLQLGVVLRAAAAAPSLGSRPRTSTDAWRAAWKRRREWTGGWRPGDVLGEPVQVPALSAPTSIPKGVGDRRGRRVTRGPSGRA